MVRDARGRLLYAALALMDERGVLAVSVEDIRVAAGASVGSLYHHFPSGKSALVGAVLDEWLGHYQAEALDALHAADGREAGVRAVVEHFLSWIQEHPAPSRVLLRFEVDPPAPLTPRSSGAGGPAFLCTVAEWLTLHAPPDTRQVSIGVLVALWIGPAKEYARGWLGGRISEPPDAVASTLADAAWQSVRRLKPTQGDVR